MPYTNSNELPENVTNVLPNHAQEIYKEAYNSAYDQYDEPGEGRDGASQEETAHRVVWSAVKQSYQKGDDGNWHKK